MDALTALAALAHPKRLAAFRLLVGSEPHGLPAGKIADATSIPQSTMSVHLSTLARAGLIAGERRSRQIVYRANVGRLDGLVRFLVDDCCGGRPEACAALSMVRCGGSA